MGKKLTIGSGRVRRASGRGTTAYLLRVAYPSAGTTNGSVRGELARRSTAVLVARITNRVRGELAGRWVATGIVSTPNGASTIALLASFNDSVSTLAPGDRRDVLVRRQARRLHTVPPNGGADIAYGASGEFLDAGSGAWVHDECTAGVTGLGTERAALLGGDGGIVGAGCRSTIMDSTKGVARLVGHDLPLGAGPHHDVGSTDGLITGRCVRNLCTVHAGLAQPRETNRGPRGTGAEKRPVGVVVRILTSPGGEQVQSILNFH